MWFILLSNHTRIHTVNSSLSGSLVKPENEKCSGNDHLNPRPLKPEKTNFHLEKSYPYYIASCNSLFIQSLASIFNSVRFANGYAACAGWLRFAKEGISRCHEAIASVIRWLTNVTWLWCHMFLVCKTAPQARKNTLENSWIENLQTPTHSVTNKFAYVEVN